METPGGITLVKRTVAPLAKAITTAVTAANAGKAGRRATAIRLLEKIPADMAAYLTIRLVVNAAMRRKGLLGTANQLGAAIDDELRLAAFQGKEPNLYFTVERRLKERGATMEHSRAVFIYTANKNNVELPGFTKSEKVHLGMKLIDLFIETTGFARVIKLRKRGRRYKTQAMLEVVEGVASGLQDWNTKAEFMRPFLLPTVIPPRPWTSLRGGGYHTENLMAFPLVKLMSKAQEKLLAAADLSVVYASLNAIQETEWRINERVLDLMSDVWRREVEIAMPKRDDLPLPEKPFDIATNEEARSAWKTEARRIHEANAMSRGKRVSIDMMLSAAEELRKEEKIYFPHQLDFRGRAYAMPTGLTPQGPDHARALLTFAASAGKPIDTPRAAGWLMIQGANLWGYDKVDLEGRIAWVEEHEDRIRSVAADPLADLWWTEADSGKKAWSFLAWCFEYAAFKDHGWGFITTLPIGVDGSCNGLQHFSAMLRDPVGGCAVNLVPQEKPNDIYQRVADRVAKQLTDEKVNDWIARGWLDFGINRKITKRPVMVLPYGGTFRSCLQYVREAVYERITTGGEANPFGDELREATSKLAKSVWWSISDVVVAARAAMDWLQKVAYVAARHNHALSWKVPSGFVAYQAYRNIRERKVKTRLHGSLIYLTQHEPTLKLDSRRQALGISPNFVHSRDGAMLMLTIELAKLNGISSFAMIHDSYGTVAPDMDMLSACLREAFVDMYVDHNVLEEFLRELPAEIQAECPPVPPMGTLDIEAVRQSDFFFA